MSSRKSQRCINKKGKKDGNGMATSTEENICTIDEIMEKFKRLEENVSQLKRECKKKEDDLKQGWESEFKTRIKIEEELARNERDKQQAMMERDIVIRRYQILEEKEQNKEALLISEMKINKELERRVEEIEFKIACLENKETTKETTKETKETKKACLESKEKNMEVLFEKIVDRNEKEPQNVLGRATEIQKVSEELEGKQDGSLVVVNERGARQDRKQDDGTCEEISNVRRKGKKKVLLIGDFNSKTAQEFCKEKCFGAWAMPRVDISELEKMVKKSKKAEVELLEEIVVYVGREDVRRNDETENIVKNLRTLFSTIKEKYGDKAEITLCKWSNKLGRYINKRLEDTCKDENVKLLRINPRWETMNNGRDKKEIWEKAIGIAIKNSMLNKQKPKEMDKDFCFWPGTSWKKKI
jgi:hypothetical protein